ncbi:CPBP family intramembrane glutamic endopeptidase [Natrinema salsiterrestre]|uniref:CPBP family intramembrane metalloprotease n=1 Tax=Natrinema salsiterrestre TaxID=2950540 RepID=A0A9Q4Q4I8_9EURY|nr:CPBP family intramembrane glutamic endopeptidase [Natrinema salsiterrestre]MDF9747258.1 CPBP family intramembrane metalloprotease [Natrinema salsiterrestre]
MATSSRRWTDGPLWSTLIAAGLAISGLFAAQFTTLPALLLDPALFTAPTETSIASRAILLILNFVGFALAGAVYLAVTGRGWAYVDLRMPTRREWGYVLAGVLGGIAFYVLVSVTVQLLSLPAAENQVSTYIGGDQTMVLVMIVIVFLFNAPAEEFLYRNIVQKRLYDAFSRLQAVAIASVIFGLIHFPVYAALSESLLATAVPVTVVVGGAAIFGYLYAKTDNLLVPIAAHAVFNGFQFGLLYLALEYDLETADPTSSLLVDVATAVAL